ncbi:MAG: sulfatase-like hydrolase/transferase [Thiogranum sp.]|nr:sulfatase-like hydrolase/transferase [Thiogranum sp.]
MLKIYLSVICCLPIFFDGYYFTGGIASALVFFLYSFLLFSIFTLLGRFYLLLAIPFLVLSSLVTAYEFLMHSKVSVNVIASILETDFHESLEFARSRFFIKFAVVCLTILFSPWVLHCLARWLRIAPLPSASVSPYAIPACLALLAGFHLADTSGDERRSINAAGIYNYFPMREMKNIERNLFQTSLVVDKYRKMHFQLDSGQDADNEISVILVIGEAARKSSMGIYGSRYATTPFVSELAERFPGKIAYMTDMVSVSAYTRVSVPSMISMCDAANFHRLASCPSIYRMLNKAGVETVYLANKAQSTFFDSVANAIMQDNKARVYNGNGTEYDGDALNALFAITGDDSAGSRLITFQLAGSHYEYDKRYPADQDCFEPAIPEAYYLSSIRYTDQVLFRVAKHLDQQKNPWVIIYTSDHGEYVNDEGDGLFGHGFKQFVRDELEVPLIFIFNDAFAGKYPHKVESLRRRHESGVSHDNLSHTVLGMLGVSDSRYYDPGHDIGSEQFREQERFIVDSAMKALNIESYDFKPVLANHATRPVIRLRTQCAGTLSGLQPGVESGPLARD